MFFRGLLDYHYEGGACTMTDEMKAEEASCCFAGRKNGYRPGGRSGRWIAMEAYCRDYKSFLDHSKTERECAGHAWRLAEAASFTAL